MFMQGTGLFGLLVLAANIWCIVHVVRNRKPLWWILVILFMPIGGVAWYFLSEMQQPGGRGHARLRMQQGVVHWTRGMVKQLETELSYHDTVDIRMKLGEALLALGDSAKALEYYRSCQKGHHQEDVGVLIGIARAACEAEAYEEALDALDDLTATGKSDYANERLLLAARSHEGLEEFEEAVACYAKAHVLLPGEEARCRYGLLLARLGRSDEARALLEGVVGNAGKSEGTMQGQNRQWRDYAEKELRRLPGNS